VIEDKDYVLKLVRRMAEVLAKMIRHRQLKEHEQALQEVGGAYQDLFGVDERFVHMMTPQAVRAALRHPARIEAFANLLREHAKLLDDLHDARATLLVALAHGLATVH
jgi:hypothetical protein